MSFLRGRKDGSTLAKVSVLVKLRMRDGWIEEISGATETGAVLVIRSGRRRAVTSGMGGSSESAVGTDGMDSVVSRLDFFWIVRGDKELLYLLFGNEA